MDETKISSIQDVFLESGSLSSTATNTCESDSFSIITNSSQTSRKRRRNLTRINLSSAKLSVSNESLNSNASSNGNVGGPLNGSQTATVLLSDDDLGEDSIQSATNVFEFDKRLRMCSQSSNGNSTNSGSKSKHILVAQASTPTDDCFNLIELECANGGSTTSVKPFQLASGGLVIGADTGVEYEIVGDGRECKAVNIQQQSVFHCLVFKPEEYLKFLTVLERIQIASEFYDVEDYNKLKNILIPESFKAIHSKNGMWYILMPDHYGNLHSLVDMNSNNGYISSQNNNTKSFSERRVQPIFKQIVSLVAFCHKIGIYFRDFRLRKFVFTNKQKTEIRLNNILELWIAPEINNDQMSQRHVCPAYVAPEILDVPPSTYAGKSADVWALGVMMFILLSGRYPFYEECNNPAALFKRIKARRFSFPLNDYITHNARWLLFGILVSDPKDRPTADEILQSHWLQTDSELLPDGLDIPHNASKLGIEATSLSFNNAPSTMLTNQASQQVNNQRLNSRENARTLASRINSTLRAEARHLLAVPLNAIVDGHREQEPLQQASLLPTAPTQMQQEIRRSLSNGGANVEHSLTYMGHLEPNGGCGGATHEDAFEADLDQVVPNLTRALPVCATNPIENVSETSAQLIQRQNRAFTNPSSTSNQIQFPTISAIRAQVSPPQTLRNSATFPRLTHNDNLNTLNNDIPIQSTTANFLAIVAPTISTANSSTSTLVDSPQNSSITNESS